MTLLRMFVGSVAVAVCFVGGCGGGGSSSSGGSGGNAAGSGGSGGTAGASATGGGGSGASGGAAAGGAAGSTGGSGGSGGSGGGVGGGGGAAGQAGGAGQSGGSGQGGAGAGGQAGGMPPAVDYFAYVSGGGSEIEGFRYDATTGALTSIGKTQAGPNPSYLAYHPQGLAIYANNESGGGTVRAFAIERGTGKLTAKAMRQSGGAGAVHVAVHPTGKWLFVSNYIGGNVRVFPLAADGDIGAEPSDTKNSGGESHQIMPDPTGKFVYVPCRGPNHIAQFKFDDVGGKLTPNAPPAVASDDPRHIAIHPNGKWAYLVNENPANENPANVVSFALDPVTGLLSAPAVVSFSKNTEASGSHIVVSPDGKYVFAGGRSTNTIFAFTVDAQTGKLTAAGDISTMIRTPRDFTISPDGQHLLVANQGLATVSVLKVGANGALTTVGAPVPTVSGAQGVIVVPVPKP